MLSYIARGKCILNKKVINGEFAKHFLAWIYALKYYVLCKIPFYMLKSCIRQSEVVESVVIYSSCDKVIPLDVTLLDFGDMDENN